MKIGAKEVDALKARLTSQAQVSTTESLDVLPPYLDSFLAHLRLLVGVPFQYLIPDARLLPDESIRFFYLDRSWTDRVIDGALAVGKVGTREMAHVQAHAAAVHQSADDGESMVRNLQRRRITDYAEEKRRPARAKAEAGTVSGFLLRSAMVSGWPHMEVRAFSGGKPLPTLRLERLSPGVLLVLWRGVPDRVELEEPHHGVQFGADPAIGQAARGGYRLFVRRSNGEKIGDHEVPVPMRSGGRGVVHVTELRRRLHQKRTEVPEAIAQTGAGAFAIALLNPPYQQPFAGADRPPPSKVPIAMRVADPELEAKLTRYFEEHHG